jgi:hypothetical protein
VNFVWYPISVTNNFELNEMIIKATYQLSATGTPITQTSTNGKISFTSTTLGYSISIEIKVIH